MLFKQYNKYVYLFTYRHKHYQRHSIFVTLSYVRYLKSFFFRKPTIVFYTSLFINLINLRQTMGTNVHTSFYNIINLLSYRLRKKNENIKKKPDTFRKKKKNDYILDYLNCHTLTL